MEYQAAGKKTGSMSQGTKDALVRYYARLPESLRIDVHRIHTRMIRANRIKGGLDEEQAAEFHYSMFLLAVAEMHNAEKALSYKARVDTERVKTISRIRLERIRGTPGKKTGKDMESIRRNFYLIRQLREDENMSWRKTARYLRSYCKVNVSFSYLRQCYKALLNERG